MIRRELVTSKNLALSTVKLQPGSFNQRGGFTRYKGNARERRMSAVFPTANVPAVFVHGLGFPPTGYTVLGSNRACRVYNDIPLKSTSRVVVLKCDTANAVVDLLVR